MSKFKTIKIYFVIVLIVALAATGIFWYFGKRSKSAVATIPSQIQESTTEDNKPAVPNSSIIDSGVPKDGIPSLEHPVFTPVTQALEELGEEGSGLVVIRGGIVRFYPYQVLSWHEVVNDEIDRVPIAVTYCALCNVAVVYQRMLQGKPINFGVSGKIHELDSLLYDRGTQSLWSQVTGEAIAGPLTGERLSVIDSSVMNLKEFAVQYPNGQVLSKFTGHVRNYDTLAYGDYAVRSDGESIITKKGLVHPKTEVVGIEVNGQFKAYPKELLQQKAVTDVLGGQTVHIAKLEKEAGLVTVNTQPLSPVTTYWFMWQAWHPETAVYQSP